METFESKITLLGDGFHVLPVPLHIAAKLRDAGHKRVICRLGEIKLHAALLKLKDFGYYIMVNKKLLKQLGAEAGDEIEATIAPDNSKYQFAVPEEFEEVMRQEPEAARIFETLKPGNQRGILHLVASVKDEQKRIDKALSIAEKLKAGITATRELGR